MAPLTLWEQQSLSLTVEAYLLQDRLNQHSASKGPVINRSSVVRGGLASAGDRRSGQDRLVPFCPQCVDDLPGVDVLDAGIGVTKVQDGLLRGRRVHLAEIGRDENGIQVCDGTGYEADLPSPIDELERSIDVGSAWPRRSRRWPVAVPDARVPP